MNMDVDSGLTDKADTGASWLPGLRARQRLARDEVIIEAACALIDERGYEAMTMEDLADRAGISKPTLYHHFGSKEAIAVRTATLRLRSTVAAVEKMALGRPKIARLEAVMRWMLAHRIGAHRPLSSGLMTNPALRPLIKTDADYQCAHADLVEGIAQIVRQAKTDGDVNPNLSSDLAAHMMLVMIKGCEYRDLIAAGTVTEQEIIDTLVRTFLTGIRRSG